MWTSARRITVGVTRAARTGRAATSAPARPAGNSARTVTPPLQSATRHTYLWSRLQATAVSTRTSARGTTDTVRARTGAATRRAATSATAGTCPAPAWPATVSPSAAVRRFGSAGCAGHSCQEEDMCRQDNGGCSHTCHSNQGQVRPFLLPYAVLNCTGVLLMPRRDAAGRGLAHLPRGLRPRREAGGRPV